MTDVENFDKFRDRGQVSGVVQDFQTIPLKSKCLGKN